MLQTSDAATDIGGAPAGAPVSHHLTVTMLEAGEVSLLILANRTPIGMLLPGGIDTWLSGP